MAAGAVRDGCTIVRTPQQPNLPRSNAICKKGSAMHEKPIWEIPGAAWVDNPPNRRFAICSGASSPSDDAVLDKETGLVWERSPATDKKALSSAIVYSTTKVAARCKGWRLPALEEMLSLVDPSANNPTLPAGYPFLNLQLDYFYWSLSKGLPVAGDLNLVWGYNFGNADTSCILIPSSCYTWLVRGGYGHNYALTV
jgi:hypothetical protein